MSSDLPGFGRNRMQAMVYGNDQLHRIPDTLGYRDRLCRRGVLANTVPTATPKELRELINTMWIILMTRMRTER